VSTCTNRFTTKKHVKKLILLRACESGPKFNFGAPAGGQIKINVNGLIVFAGGLRLYLQRKFRMEESAPEDLP
jgi:hypothetical protein